MFLLFLIILGSLITLVVYTLRLVANFMPRISARFGEHFPRGAPRRDIPESHIRGDAFEDFIESAILSRDFELVYRTPSYEETRANYDSNARLPDFLYHCHRRGEQFWVEAKFRAATMEGKVEWCRYDQLMRYRRVHVDQDVFVAIGLGGRPDRPHRLFIVPLDALKYTGVYLSVLEPFEVEPHRPLSSGLLWEFAMQG